MCQLSHYIFLLNVICLWTNISLSIVLWTGYVFQQPLRCKAVGFNSVLILQFQELIKQYRTATMALAHVVMIAQSFLLLLLLCLLLLLLLQLLCRLITYCQLSLSVYSFTLDSLSMLFGSYKHRFTSFSLNLSCSHFPSIWLVSVVNPRKLFSEISRRSKLIGHTVSTFSFSFIFFRCESFIL